MIIPDLWSPSPDNASAGVTTGDDSVVAVVAVGVSGFSRAAVGAGAAAGVAAGAALFVDLSSFFFFDFF